MDELARILFHMHFVDPYFLGSCSCLDLHIAVSRDRQVELRDLIVLRIIRVEVVLPVKLAHLGDLTVSRKPDRHRVLYHLFVQHRQGARHSGAHRTCMRVRRAAEFCAAAAEDLRLSSKLDMHFKSNDCLILFCHVLYASFPNSAGVSYCFSVAHSYVYAARMRVFSWNTFPISCIPIGSPLLSFPTGTLMPGSPARLTEIV